MRALRRYLSPASKPLFKEISELREQIAALENELSNEAIEDRIDSILSNLSRDMSAWARELRLEHSEHPLRLDLKRLTVVADGADGVHDDLRQRVDGHRRVTLRERGSLVECLTARTAKGA